MKKREKWKGKRWGSKWIRGEEGCPGPTRGTQTAIFYMLICGHPARKIMSQHKSTVDRHQHCTLLQLRQPSQHLVSWWQQRSENFKTLLLITDAVKTLYYLPQHSAASPLTRHWHLKININYNISFYYFKNNDIKIHRMRNVTWNSITVNRQTQDMVQYSIKTIF